MHPLSGAFISSFWLADGKEQGYKISWFTPTVKSEF